MSLVQITKHYHSFLLQIPMLSFLAHGMETDQVALPFNTL